MPHLIRESEKKKRYVLLRFLGSPTLYTDVRAFAYRYPTKAMAERICTDLQRISKRGHDVEAA